MLNCALIEKLKHIREKRLIKFDIIPKDLKSSKYYYYNGYNHFKVLVTFPADPYHHYYFALYHIYMVYFAKTSAKNYHEFRT